MFMSETCIQMFIWWKSFKLWVIFRFRIRSIKHFLVGNYQKSMYKENDLTYSKDDVNCWNNLYQNIFDQLCKLLGCWFVGHPSNRYVNILFCSKPWHYKIDLNIERLYNLNMLSPSLPFHFWLCGQDGIFEDACPCSSYRCDLCSSSSCQGHLRAGLRACLIRFLVKEEVPPGMQYSFNEGNEQAK